MSFGEGHHWISETVAPTGVQPTMITRRGTAATSISFRKPDWRSHSSTMPEKMELNRTVMPMTFRGEELYVAAGARPLQHRPQSQSQGKKIPRRLPK